MQIYCGRCGESVDPDELHEVTDPDTGNPLPYLTAARRFRAYGCAALEGHTHSTCEQTDNIVAAMARAVMDLSDYPDDWASDLDDLRYVEGV